MAGEVAKTGFPTVTALAGVWLTQTKQNRREADQAAERRHEQLAAERLDVYVQLLEWIEETLAIVWKWGRTTTTDEL